MIEKKDIDHVKVTMDRHIGHRVKIRANKGRKKVVIREGIIFQTYPSIFIVKVNSKQSDVERCISFSYTDILTKNIQLSLCQ
ncbi:MAG: Veg protein [Clostridiales bacterium]|jgi:uncharacterized protein Veg|nr:Veg protein [Clostridiales bacterium]